MKKQRMLHWQTRKNQTHTRTHTHTIHAQSYGRNEWASNIDPHRYSHHLT